MKPTILLLPVALLLGSCAGVKDYNPSPQLSIVGSGTIGSGDAVSSLFGTNTSTPFVIELGEADPQSRKRLKEKGGISAKGLGGIALPLVLKVTGIEVIDRKQTATGYSLTTRLKSTVNGIPPACGKVTGTITGGEGGKPFVMEFRNFYCNWAVIGNVVTNLKLSLDQIDVKNNEFSGSYSLKFNGTGNAAGSGYYSARVKPQ
ncbi:MAG: hypothetical protein AAGH89_06010 [Verrucomicrobiota bacterium]